MLNSLSPFTFSNNRTGFDELFGKLKASSKDLSQIKVGLEATGHFSDNLLEFLISKGLTAFVINPLHTNLYRKGLSLRKTKTDKVDANSILNMLRTENLKSYSHTSYHIRELKSLTRYRFSLVQDCARLKTSFSRLCVILFPELESLVPNLNMASVYALLSELPGAQPIASCHLTRLTSLLHHSSKGRYSRDKAIEIRNAARASVGSHSNVKSLELQQTTRLIQLMEEQIAQVESKINNNILQSSRTFCQTIQNCS